MQVYADICQSMICEFYMSVLPFTCTIVHSWQVQRLSLFQNLKAWAVFSKPYACGTLGVDFWSVWWGSPNSCHWCTSCAPSAAHSCPIVCCCDCRRRVLECLVEEPQFMSLVQSYACPVPHQSAWPDMLPTTLPRPKSASQQVISRLPEFGHDEQCAQDLTCSQAQATSCQPCIVMSHMHMLRLTGLESKRKIASLYNML